MSAPVSPAAFNYGLCRVDLSAPVRPRKVMLEIAELLDTMPHRGPALEVGFDMEEPWLFRATTKHPCGTAMCIGGWVQKLVPETREMRLSDAVMHVATGMSGRCAHLLCYEGIALFPTTTPQHGAQAIRNALTYDDPKWSEVLA